MYKEERKKVMVKRRMRSSDGRRGGRQQLIAFLLLNQHAQLYALLSVIPFSRIHIPCSSGANILDDELFHRSSSDGLFLSKLNNKRSKKVTSAKPETHHQEHRKSTKSVGSNSSRRSPQAKFEHRMKEMYAKDKNGDKLTRKYA